MIHAWLKRSTLWQAAADAALLALCCLALVLSGTASAQEAEAEEEDEGPALEHVLEFGASYTWHSAALGSGDYEFARYTLERENSFVWELETGHAARFDDSGFGFSTSLSRSLAAGFYAMAGYGTGTGDYEVFPEYRWDVGLGRAFLGEDTVLFALVYTREQSKIANYYDGFGAELEYYRDEHWIAEGFGRYEVGYPGRTTSLSGGAGLTYSVWKKWALGGAVELGSVAYELFDPEEPLVDYNRVAFSAHYQRYLRSNFGFGTHLEYEHNDEYDLFTAAASVFREW
ncbi:MAG: YaiO family outer membrane beta-barrel protein [Chitinivibrionia bacterium]|nr:YaiO family outer membrane beta-barrel protein [Chitinivibrionia bacterium]